MARGFRMGVGGGRPDTKKITEEKLASLLLQAVTGSGVTGCVIGDMYIICYVRTGGNTGDPPSGCTVLWRRHFNTGSIADTWFGCVRATSSNITFSGSGNVCAFVHIT